METITTEFEYFQRGGAEETLRLASQAWEATNEGRGRRVIEAKFIAASPGRMGEGRWVTIALTHTLDRSYSYVD